MIPHLSIPQLQEVDHPVIRNAGVKLLVLRDDLVHPYLSGNKWRKLKYNLEDFKSSGKKALVTFGGAYSNHLVATAAAGNLFHIPTIGIVRGEEEPVNDYIRFMKRCGMKLLYISRDEYRDKEVEKTFQKIIQNVLEMDGGNTYSKNDLFILPEGGSNPAAVKGCKEIVNDLPEDINVIVCACGTGATLAGIGLGMHEHQQALGFAVLRGEKLLPENLQKYQADNSRIKIIFDYHFGGYAKRPPELLAFCTDFHLKTGIPLEPVYTGKLFFGLMNLIEKGYFQKGMKLAAIHTGGIFDFQSPL